ncbi:MAG: hypothetical protein ABGY95_09515 [Rubritalea sp.]|uniref:hypothetical protein n=1 Tax=Rubritalea sp. TaxID=2109375 RepID=UPI003242E58C
MIKLNYISTLALALGLASCSETPEDVKAPEVTEATKGLASLVVSAAPTDATSIADLRTSAKVGDDVVFSGKVIGSSTVFVEGRAIMVIGDPQKITSCDLIHGDNCRTPWDVCCDDHDVIKGSIVTVQVVDADGKPLKEGFKNVAGIKELSNLVISGKVAEGSNDDNMLINATSLFVAK